MSRSVNSVSINYSHFDDRRSRGAHSKTNLEFGSKKTRNQANCSQYFVKTELSKNKLTLSKQNLNESSRGASKRSQVLASADNTFHMKIQRQLEGRLSEVSDRNPNWAQNRNKSVSDVRVVDDEKTRHSLATLATGIDFVPKLKKSQLSITNEKKFTLSNPTIQRTADKSNPKGRQITGYYGLKNDSYEEPKIFVKRDLFTRENEYQESTEHPRLGLLPAPRQQASLSDVNQYYQRRNPLRHPKAPGSASTQISHQQPMKRWEFIDEIEKKIQKAINRSRSRGGSQDFSYSQHTESASNRPKEDTEATELTGSKDRFREGEQFDGNQRYEDSPEEKNLRSRDQNKASLQMNRSTAELTLVEGAGQNTQGYTTTGTSQSQYLLNKHSLHYGSHALLQNDAPAATIEKLSDGDEVKIYRLSDNPGLPRTRPRLEEDSFSRNQKLTLETNEKHSKLQDSPEYRAPFNSFRIPEQPTPNLKQSQGDFENLESPGWTYQNAKRGDFQLGKDSQSFKPGAVNTSQISGISPIAKADRSGFADTSTPSLVTHERKYQAADIDSNRYQELKQPVSAAGQADRAEHSYELNSNFLKRVWNLRFVSSQELKILIADSIIFIGDKKNGLKCGKGKFITQRGGRILYEGYFYDNLYHGEGKLWNPKHCKPASGSWFSNLDDAECWELYEGHFSGGYPEGFGRLTMVNGDSVSGVFLRGRLNGAATIVFASSGASLSGEWQDNALINTTT